MEQSIPTQPARHKHWPSAQYPLSEQRPKRPGHADRTPVFDVSADRCNTRTECSVAASSIKLLDARIVCVSWWSVTRALQHVKSRQAAAQDSSSRRTGMIRDSEWVACAHNNSHFNHAAAAELRRQRFPFEANAAGQLYQLFLFPKTDSGQCVSAVSLNSTRSAPRKCSLFNVNETTSFKVPSSAHTTPTYI